MCGICGKFEFNGQRVDAALVSRMCGTIMHRGPDDEGVYAGPYIGLGQRRLAIIDLNRRGTAPLPNEDETIWITFNGEIYNFQDLRERLIERGHTFRTATDTEVIVHLYEEHGLECLDHLHGMFAFAIWDSRAKRLFAARDRLGKKPFYYSRTGTSFTFGSEIKAVTADPDVRIEPDLLAIDGYLTYQYVGSPRTAFAGIAKLPPAHFLTCDTKGALDVRRYWRPPLPRKTTRSPADLEQELLERLRAAVRSRLLADVPLGAFLSGGIDSSAIVALMAEAADRPVKTFSIGFEGDRSNELPYAREVAGRFGTEHHEIVVGLDAAETLPRLVWHYNEPFADPSALPTFHLAKVTREHVTVALSGDGGDESFAGYGNYEQVARWHRADVIPAGPRRFIGHQLAALIDRLPYGNDSARAGRALFMFGADVPARFRLQCTVVKPREKREAYTKHFRALVNGCDRNGAFTLPWSENADAMDWMMCHDQHFYLPDCLMVKTDVASMANSLEVRCPLLDHTFIEFAATIPSRLKRDATGGKVIFKRALRGLLPDSILNRGKVGFGLPLSTWLQRDLSGLVRATLLDDRAIRRNLFEPAFIGRMVEDQVALRRDWSHRLWAFLCLELWFREFID